MSARASRLDKRRFGAESLERPAPVRTPTGRWRLHLSRAGPGTKHWRIDAVEAADPAALAGGVAQTWHLLISWDIRRCHV